MRMKAESRPRMSWRAKRARSRLDILGKPIGKQDHYIVAYGGLRCIEFRPGGEVEVLTIPMPDDVRRELSDHLLLFFTGVTRKSADILTEQKEFMADHFGTLRGMRDQARELRHQLEIGNIDAVGHAMREGGSSRRNLRRKFQIHSG